MQSKHRAPATAVAIGWTCMLLAALPTVAYILSASLAPELLGRPVAIGTPISVGLVLGLGLAVVLVALALFYTRRLNQRDRQLPPEHRRP